MWCTRKGRMFNSQATSTQNLSKVAIVPVSWREGRVGTCQTTWPCWKTAVVGPEGCLAAPPKLVQAVTYSFLKQHGSQLPLRAPCAWKLEVSLWPFGDAWVGSEARGQQGSGTLAGLTWPSGRSKKMKAKCPVRTTVVLGVPTTSWWKPAGIRVSPAPCPPEVRPLQTRCGKGGGRFSQRRCFG